MIAITRVEGRYCIADTVTRDRGWYKEDGTFIEGEKVLTEDEAGFRIFAQQSPLSDAQARRAWNSKK